MTLYFQVWDSEDEKPQWKHLNQAEIKQKLGICNMQSQINVLQTLLNDTNEAMIDEVWKPKARKLIMALLTKKGEVRTSQIRRFAEFSFFDKAWNNALDDLVNEGIVLSISQGRGRQRLWRLAEQ